MHKKCKKAFRAQTLTNGLSSMLVAAYSNTSAAGIVVLELSGSLTKVLQRYYIVDHSSSNLIQGMLGRSLMPAHSDQHQTYGLPPANLTNHSLRLKLILHRIPLTQTLVLLSGAEQKKKKLLVVVATTKTSLGCFQVVAPQGFLNRRHRASLLRPIGYFHLPTLIHTFLILHRSMMIECLLVLIQKMKLLLLLRQMKILLFALPHLVTLNPSQCFLLLMEMVHQGGQGSPQLSC
mmetsp:Transcript_18343/g.33260  ORF Transcript_18343/g.33260 Transcript_18343/m.33260 type:complete len:234 (+) Transcript_18343:386-1087(+)